jgi:high-affinity iron transporter
MLRIPMKWFFSVTNALILLLAAGMASRMAQFLIQANVLPSLKSPLWDSSAVLPAHSAVGTFMHALAGYEATPSGMQVVFYVTTLIIVLPGMRLTRPAVPQSS